MKYTLKQQVRDLVLKIEQLELELSQWEKVGDAFLKFYHYKKINKALSKTKFFFLMFIYKIKESKDMLAKKLNEALF